MVTPTQRTLAALREKGMRVGMVERFNHHAGPFGIRQDLFGIIDMIALDKTRGVVGVQSTGQDFSGHMQKILGPGRDAAIYWLQTPGAHLELWGWRKLKAKRGGKAMVWAPRVHVFSLGEVQEEPMSDRPRNR